MGKRDITFSIDVRGVDETLDDLEEHIADALEHAGNDVLTAAWKSARHTLRVEDAIWNKDVLRRFDDEVHQDRDGSVEAVLTNYSDHASVVEYGATYTDEPPNFENLIPWVKDNLGDWHPDLPDGHGGGGSPDESDSPLRATTAEDDIAVGEDYLWEETNVTVIGTVVTDNGDGTYEVDVDGETRNMGAYKVLVEPDRATIDPIEYNDIDNNTKVWWRDDAGKPHVGVVDGVPMGTMDGPRWSNLYIDEPGNDNVVKISPAMIVRYDTEWQDGEDFLLSMDFKTVGIKTAADTQYKDIYYKAEVAAYNRRTDESMLGVYMGNPHRSDGDLLLDDGRQVSLDDDWEVYGYREWSTLTRAKQEGLAVEHFETHVTNQNLSDAQFAIMRDAFRDDIVPTIRDEDHLRKMVRQWNVIRHDPDQVANGTPENTRAHVLKTSSGWRLQVAKNEKGEVIVHEFGHAWSEPLNARKGNFASDPDEWKHSIMWASWSDANYAGMWEAKLPKWRFIAGNHNHGVPQIYLFSEDNASDYVDDTLGTDDRDQMPALGWEQWANAVLEVVDEDIAGFDGSFTTESRYISEVNPRQIMKPQNDAFQLEEGTFVAVKVDGELRVREFAGWEGEVNGMLFENGEYGWSMRFNDLSGSHDRDIAFVNEDGDLMQSEDPNNNGVYSLVPADNVEFLGTVDKTHVETIDPTDMPSLTQPQGSPERLQEAANMAWWYQALFIEQDTSLDKKASKHRVLKRGYSATNAEEVMAEFSELLTGPVTFRTEPKVEMLIETYPYFITEYLLHRTVSPEVANMLRDAGYTVP